MGFERMASTLLFITIFFFSHVLVRVVYGESFSDKRELILTSLVAMSSDPNSVPDVPSKDNTNRINPHWDKSRCNVCHDKARVKSASDIKKPSEKDLCMECHEDDISHIYIHPIGLAITKKRMASISKRWNGNLRLDSNARMTCQTCHDLLDQCLPERTHQAKRNPRFLRGGPYPKRYSLCYRCHDSAKYERRNSHDQIADNGMLKLEKCRLCHEIDTGKKIPRGIKKDLSKYPLLKGLNEDRTLLCIRCHRKIDHPSSAFRVRSEKKYRHLVKIGSNEKKTLMQQTTETGIDLPLEPNTDRIYCGTCHQPHQWGVFAGEDPKSAPVVDRRLRSDPICKHCHDIYGSLMESGTK